MKRQLPVSFVLTALLAAAILVGCGAKTTPTDPMSSTAGINLRIAMRALWDAHTTWTRMYIVSAVAKLPDAATAAARLMQNQEDIGNAIKPYYGDDAGMKLTALLKNHISTAAAVVAAAMGTDTMKLKATQTQWTANADSIADFLAGANPNWPKQALTDMLHEHLRLTTDEAVARIKKDWTGDVKAYDAIHTQAMMMADALSSGIIRQFPDKFKTDQMPAN
jgi:hypothetical protein